MSRPPQGAAAPATLPEMGDDVADVPNPVTEKPPAGRFCDLVLTGGVASGVVYPWAIVELARAYHFKCIGGTSVGAMAAALAAAAEYGRRCGAPQPFEVLRRLPGKLAEDAGQGRTRLLALFQPGPRCQRLFDIFVDGVRVFGGAEAPSRREQWGWLRRTLCAFHREALRVALWTVAGCTLVGLLVVAALVRCGLPYGFSWTLALLPLAAIAAAAGIVCAVLRDVREGLIANDLGLVRGGPLAGTDHKADPGLVAWLHEGIQRSAGFNPDDPRNAPLTFRDLWRAPAYPGAALGDGAANDAPGHRSINLAMVTTNVTLGRPFRLPLDDETTRLYFRQDELAPFFPDDVMRALMRAAKPYRQHSPADPQAARGVGFFELPGADLPIVVAARLSLSFPLLFSAVPLYAVDYERREGQRELERCRFSDGGICSNFPIHLFDTAAPRWPTFGMWLGKRGPYHDDPVWLPDNHLSGRGDIWTRFEPKDARAKPLLRTLGGFVAGAVLSAKDWGDRSSMRMPQVRHRVARLNLKSGEGELNIAMPRTDILRMAQDYGTRAGLTFVEQFAAEPGKPPKPAWREHQWVRLHTLLHSLRGFLAGLPQASRCSAHTVPLRELIESATQRRRGVRVEPPLRSKASGPDAAGHAIDAAQAAALHEMLDAAEALEDALRRCDVPLNYRPVPMPELRVRPPI